MADTVQGAAVDQPRIAAAVREILLAIGEDPARDGLQDTINAVRRAFRYAERPNRFLYGSDWPLAPMTAYRDFIRSAVPEVYHSQVLEENARSLFRLG